MTAIPWQGYAVSVRLKEPAPTRHGWRARSRRWLVARFGWRWPFRERDWMSLRQMLESAQRRAYGDLSRRMMSPFYCEEAECPEATE